MNWVVGGLKMSVSGVCARLCHRLLLVLLSVCQLSYGHTLPLKWEKIRSLSLATFFSSVLTFVSNDLSRAWIYSVVMTLIAKCTGSDEPKCHSFPAANISWRVLHFCGVECIHSTVYHREVEESTARETIAIWNISVRRAAYFTENREYCLHFLFKIACETSTHYVRDNVQSAGHHCKKGLL